MNAATIEAWLNDGKVIESYEISPGYQLVIKQETACLEVYAVNRNGVRNVTSELTIEDARAAVKSYTEWFTTWLEKRREKEPTPAQLAMFFRWKIPIPLDLTFGQAWDTIDARLKQERAARAEKRRANFKLVRA